MFEEEDAVMKKYTVTGLGSLRGSSVFAKAINSPATVVGSITGESIGSANVRPFRYTGAGLQLLETPFGLEGEAVHVNPLEDNSPEQIVGFIDLGAPKAALWIDGQYQDLHTLLGGVSTSQAFDVNDSGTVVGWANSHAFRFGGACQQVETLLPGEDSSMATAV